MKNITNIYRFTILFVLSIALIAKVAISSCIESSNVYLPVYLSEEEFKSAITFQPNFTVANPIEIHTMDSYVYIVDSNKGIIILDNTNPNDLTPIGRINIPGVNSIIIQNNIIIADSATDLITINIEDTTNPQEIKRLSNILSSNVKPRGIWGNKVDESQGIVVDKIYERTSGCNDTITSSSDSTSFGCTSNKQDTLNENYNQLEEIERYFKRMIVIDNLLYVINEQNILLVNIDTFGNIQLVDKVAVEAEVSAISHLGDRLLAGTRRGVMGYRINDDGLSFETSYNYQPWQCQEILFKGTTAFTIENVNNKCGANTNLLEILNFENIDNPEKVSNYPVFNPMKIDVSDTAILIADKDKGLIVLDRSNIQNPSLANQIDAPSPISVNQVDNIALLLSKNGLYQYDINNLNDIYLISYFPF